MRVRGRPAPIVTSPSALTPAPSRKRERELAAGCAAAILAGAAMLAWPALVNGYPLVFSDTAGLADMGLEPNMGWDKPWVYGPLILLVHWGVSLWGVVAAQCLLLSALLFRVGRAAGAGGPAAHLAVCAVLAAGSAAPWFATFVMPDILAPVTVLCVALLAFGGLRRAGLLAAGLLAAVAIAAHLAHLIIACGCLVAVGLTRPRRLPACAVPLVLALAWLVGCNWVGNGVAAVSPYGSVFALARLQADGPAAELIHRICPRSGDRVCAWSDQLPMDSDAFLWSPDGPMWADRFGPTLFAPEASRLVRQTVLADPVGVAAHAAANTARQLGRDALGDTLGPQHLLVTVGLLLSTYFPSAEMARFLQSRQLAGTLPAVAAPLEPLRLLLLGLGAAGTVALAAGGWRRNRPAAQLATVVLLGVLANAFATGALSGPHDRYGARIAWLVLLPPGYAALAARRRRTGRPDAQPVTR